MAKLNARQETLVKKYITMHPHIAELLERAKNGKDAYVKTLGDAIAALPYPATIDGTDALELGRIGIAEDH